MPISLDPNETFELTLDIDSNKSIKPVFICKYLTAREHKKALALLSEVMKKDKDIEIADGYLDVIKMCITNWKNIAIPFSPDSFEDVLTINEIWELGSSILGRMMISQHEKKVSAQQLALDTVNSAKVALEENVNAESTKKM